MRRVVALVTLVLVAGCSGSGPGSGTGAGPAPDGYAVTVTRGGQELLRLDVAALRALPQTSVSTPGSGGEGVQEGPATVEVLAAAGVTGAAEVAIGGDGEPVTFTAAELDGTVLDFTNRDTVKLAGAELPTDRWVRNVTTIDVP